jgi:asparagine synthase (glutamine-hydrolysing)
MAWARHVPKVLRRIASYMADRLPRGSEGIYLLRLMGRFCQRIDARDSQRYAPWIAYFQDSDKTQGYGDALRPQQANSSLATLDKYFDEAMTMVSGAAQADFHTYLPDDLMVKMDIASMAYGLEARSPLLDEKLLNWAMAIPDIHRFPPGQTKGLFKASLSSILPASVLNRPKSGFGVPLKSWLSGELLSYSRDLLYSDEFRGRDLIRPDFVDKLFSEHESGRYFHHPRIWALVMLELWFRMWIDPPAGAEIGRR